MSYIVWDCFDSGVLIVCGDAMRPNLPPQTRCQRARNEVGCKPTEFFPEGRGPLDFGLANVLDLGYYFGRSPPGVCNRSTV